MLKSDYEIALNPNRLYMDDALSYGRGVGYDEGYMMVPAL